VVDTIADSAFGQVMRNGIISGFDTSAFSAGAAVYLSPTTAGGLTATRPSGTTNYVQRIGTILVSGVGNGSLDVHVVPALLNMETGTNAATWTGQAIVLNDTTDSTSTTTGAFQCKGGGAFAKALTVGTGFGCNGKTPQTAYASGGAAPAGGTGATAGAYDTAAHRDALITLVNNIRLALIANGIMS